MKSGMTIHLVGGPRPYREAMLSRLKASEVPVVDVGYLDLSTAQHAGRTILVYCAKESDWSSLRHAAEAGIAVAILERPVFADYVRALAANAAAVYIDTSTKHIADVAVAATEGEVLLPFAVAQALAATAWALQMSETLSDSDISLASKLVDGYTTEQIARELSYSERTIRRQLRSLYLRIGAKNRAEAIVLLRRHRATRPEEWRRAAEGG